MPVIYSIVEETRERFIQQGLLSHDGTEGGLLQGVLGFGHIGDGMHTFQWLNFSIWTTVTINLMMKKKERQLAFECDCETMRSEDRSVGAVDI